MARTGRMRGQCQVGRGDEDNGNHGRKPAKEDGFGNVQADMAEDDHD